MSQWVDFKEVKTLVTMSVLLQRYRVILRGNGAQLRGACPLPSHTSRDGLTFNVNLDRHIWSCKSASCISNRNGKEGGNVLDFVMQMEQCDLKTAAGKIVEWYGTKPESTSGIRQNTHSQTQDPMGNAEEHNLVDWLDATHASQQKNPPTHGQAGIGANNPSPLDDKSSAQKGNGYCSDVDRWLDGLLVEPLDRKKIGNAVKARLIDSYKAGKAAAR
jgi:hypothetical protein